jgi:hypothetical protein
MTTNEAWMARLRLQRLFTSSRETCGISMRHQFYQQLDAGQLCSHYWMRSSEVHMMFMRFPFRFEAGLCYRISSVNSIYARGEILFKPR